MIAERVEKLGGIHENSVTQRLHYLIVSPDGNRAWAFACYGRKIEKAMKMRKEGHRLAIVHENDFWDAIMDAG